MVSRRARIEALWAAALVLIAPVASGCSLAFVRGPSSTDSEAPPECTTSPVAPILDFTYVVGAGGLVVAMSSACSGGTCESAAPGLLVAAAVASAIPVAVSSITGLKRIYECREAQSDWCSSHGGCPGDDVGRPDDAGVGELRGRPPMARSRPP
jgi:hypothetical protein